MGGVQPQLNSYLADLNQQQAAIAAANAAAAQAAAAARNAGAMSDAQLRSAQLQNDMLAAQVAALQAQTDAKAQFMALAGQYLGTWNETLQGALGLFNTAADTVQGLITDSKANMTQLQADAQANMAKLQGDYNENLGKSQGEVDQFLKTAYAAIDDSDAKIGDAIKNVEGAALDYTKTFGGLEGAAIETAMLELGAKKSLTAQLTDLSRPDMAGAATRAKADVANEAASGRAKMADQLVALGIDPTSGTGRAMMRDSMDSEGLNKVLAGNLARGDERLQSAAMTTQALNAIDPSKSAGIALGIREGQRGLMSDKNDLIKAGIAAKQGGLQTVRSGLDANADILQARLGGITAQNQYVQTQGNLANQATQTQGGLANSLANIATGMADAGAQAGDFGAALLGTSI